MRIIPAAEALRSYRANDRNFWNLTTSSSVRSDNPAAAANRIYDGLADVRARYAGPRFPATAPVFTMGSCFAREIEAALLKRGGRVVSVDRSIRRPEFHDATGRTRSGFFHRFTPTAMAQEFRWPFGREPDWSDDALIFDNADGTVVDVNYRHLCADRTREATATRRAIAADLVRTMRGARIIIVTLGLTESWTHLPSGLVVNAIDVRHLRRHPADYELRLVDHAATIAALENILQLIDAEHVDGDYQFFVTVSPVPFIATFTDEDVVVANLTSKSTLRAAATDFAAAHGRVHYFPSYEIVTYSDPARAWRPDRLHVEPPMVAHIMDRFVDTVFEEGALPA